VDKLQSNNSLGVVLDYVQCALPHVNCCVYSAVLLSLEAFVTLPLLFVVGMYSRTWVCLMLVSHFAFQAC
jgi:hypothetical protein